MPLRRAGKKKMRAPLLGSAKLYITYTLIYIHLWLSFSLCLRLYSHFHPSHLNGRCSIESSQRHASVGNHLRQKVPFVSLLTIRVDRQEIEKNRSEAVAQ